MTITIEINKNKWLLQIEENKAGLNTIKRYRNKTNIKKIVEQLASPNIVLIGINDMKLFYDDAILVLKNYRKNKNRYLYKKVVGVIDPSIEVVNVLSTNIGKLKRITNSILNKKTIAMAAIYASLVIASPIFNNQSHNEQIYDDQPHDNQIYDIQLNDNQISISKVNDIKNALYETAIKNALYEAAIEIDFNIDECMSLDNRIMQIENIEDNGKFNICSNLNEYTLNKMVSYMEENEYIYKNASLKYGVDPYLLLSFSMTESSLLHDQTIPGGTYYNGSAIGAMQIEKSHIGKTLTAYNYQTKEYETVEITSDKLTSLSSNIEIGAMIIQNHLERYNNNIYIAIQAYNYGTTAMDVALQKYADDIGKTINEVNLNVNDFGWMKYVDDIHNNPKKYFPYWKKNTFGNNYYIYSILGYYMGQNIINSGEDDYYIYDLVSNTCKLQTKNPKQNIYDMLLKKISSEVLSQEDINQLSR